MTLALGVISGVTFLGGIDRIDLAGRLALACSELPFLLFLVNLGLFRRPGRPWNKRPLPKISVLIPARNEERSIGKALASVRASRGVDIEIIVLDDGRVGRVAIVYCDSKVQSTQEFTAGDALKLEPAGGGGTAFAPALAHVAEHCPEAAAIIYLTDLECYGRAWGTEPEMPLIWCAWGSLTAAPFGEVVPLDPYS